MAEKPEDKETMTRQYGLTESFKQHVGEVVCHTFWYNPIPSLKKAGAVAIKGVVGKREKSNGGLEYVVSIDFFLANGKTFEDVLNELPTTGVFQNVDEARIYLEDTFGCNVIYQ